MAARSIHVHRVDVPAGGPEHGQLHSGLVGPVGPVARQVFRRNPARHVRVVVPQSLLDRGGEGWRIASGAAGGCGAVQLGDVGRPATPELLLLFATQEPRMVRPSRSLYSNTACARPS